MSRPGIVSHLRIRGHVIFKLHDAAGRVQSTERHNLVVDAGLEVLAKLLAGTAEDNDQITYIGVGTGGHAEGDPTLPLPPNPDDTALEAEVARHTIDSTSHPGGGLAVMACTFDKDVANGDITEAGLFTLGGTLVSRVTRTPVTKTSDWYLTVTWQLALSNEEA
ncbi:MAG: hypothetical protein ABFE07_29530 [Armatimonadia bacterium]